MNTVLTVLLTILIFGAVIFVHEFGHFIACRLTGVRVIEFAMGMGPALWKHQGKRTLYCLRLFPIGGFCSMEGEDAAGSGTIAPGTDPAELAPAELAPEESALTEGTPAESALSEGTPAEPAGENKWGEKTLLEVNIPKRLLIFAAGALMNLILGFLILLATLAAEPYYTSTQVAKFKENATSIQTGLQAGDQIIKIDSTTIFSSRDIPFALLRDNDGVVDMTVRRGEEKVKLTDVTFTSSGEGKDRTLYLDFFVYGVKASVFGGIAEAGKETFSLARNAWVSIADLITGKIGFKDMSGPVGVGQVIGQAVENAAEIGWGNFFFIAAFITISIGMFNVLPFPALDGGRIVFLLVEAVRGKPINPKWEGYVNAAGLLLLFGLMILVTFKDIFNLF